MKHFIPSTRTQMKFRGRTDSNRNFEIALVAYDALIALRDAGERGVAPARLNIPDPAKTIRELRKKGFVIETRRANNPRNCNGLDLRYVLLSAVFFTEYTVIKEYRYAR
jgi:hypothetical protein